MEPSTISPIFALIFALLVFVVVFKSVLVIPENRRGALFRLGRFVQIVGPGLIVIVPFIDMVQSVNLNDKLPGWQALSGEQLSQKVRELILKEMK